MKYQVALRAFTNDITHKTTKAKQINDIAICEMLAAEIVNSLIFIINRPNAEINPSNPTKTAACIKILRKFSARLAKYPSRCKTNPKNAGINAVMLALPFAQP